MKTLILGAAPLPDDEGAPPVWLAEQSGEMLVERFVRACAELGGQLIFAMRAEDVRRYRLDSVISLAAPGSAVVSVRGQTLGAACTALLCIQHIDPDDELLILSGNEIVDASYGALVDEFRGRGLDAGVPVFHALHPRYSYVRLDENGFVVEAAEKNPISYHALAGFTWYRRGGDFVAAAQAMIRKDARVNGNFFISLTLNELVLRQKKIGVASIDVRQYMPLKSRRQVIAYESGAHEAGPPA